MSTGSVTVSAPVNGGAPAGCGYVQALYVPPATYANHPTQWRVNGGAWRNVGSAAATVTAGMQVTITFQALNSDDRAPGAVNVSVPSTKLVKLNVAYT